MDSKKLLSAALAASVLLASCGQAPSEPEAAIGKPVRTAVAAKAPFADEIRVTGRVSARLETAVSSQVSGVIRSVSVSAGDRVKKGQVLATVDLSNSAISASYNSASDAYSNALASYSANVDAAKIQLDNAKISRDNLYKSTEPTVATFRSQLADLSGAGGSGVLDSGKTALETFKANSQANMDSLNARLGNTYATLRGTLQSARTAFDKALDQADVIMGVTDANRGKNAGYESFLAAKDSARLTVAKAAFDAARAAFDGWSLDVSSNDAIESSVSSLLPVADAMADLYSKLYSVMQATVPGGSLTAESLAALTSAVTGLQGSTVTGPATVIGAQSALSSAKLSLEDLKNSIQQTEISNRNTLLTLQNNVGLGKSQAESALAGLLAQREASDNAYKAAQAQYQSSLSASRQALAGSRGQKDVASVQLANSRIAAPFDGYVLSKSVEVGNLVSPGMPLFMIGDSSSFRIKADVTSEAASMLVPGQPFTVEKESDSVPAKLEVVAPGADPATRMVRIEMSPSAEAPFLKWGDYVSLTAAVSRPGAPTYSLPFSALVPAGQGDFQAYVVGSGSFVRSAALKLGRQNSSRVEVREGLSAGDVVVVQGALSLRDGDFVSEIAVPAASPAVSSESVPAGSSGSADLPRADRPEAP